MSSQKYAKYDLVDSGAHVWKCKIVKDDCAFTSFSNRKPMCEKCPVAKDYKKKVKAGKARVRDILEKKEG